MTRKKNLGARSGCASSGRSRAVAVFSRVPVPGEAKSRLIPTLGAELAAGLQAKMTEHIVAAGTAVEGADLFLFGSPNAEHPYFFELASRYSMTLRSQLVNPDLGARMHAALSVLLENYDRVILVGSDCPSLRAVELSAALTVLDENDLVFGAALDGGYVYVGARRIDPAVFHDIPWSTETVLRDTVKRVGDLGWKVNIRGPYSDIDVGSDLFHLPPRLAAWLKEQGASARAVQPARAGQGGNGSKGGSSA